MSVAAISFADALLNHPWVAHAAVADSQGGRPGVALQPSAEGIAVLRQSGRHALLQALGEWLAARDTARPSTWRLCDDWPLDADANWATALLAQPRPDHATILAAHVDAEQALISLQLPLDLSYFDIHFPQLPVLPGFVQIAWALAQGAVHLGTPTSCRRVELLKFHRPLRPGDQVELSLRRGQQPASLHFAYAQGDVAHSSGRLALEHGHG